jgi:ankyrin repeat protein
MLVDAKANISLKPKSGDSILYTAAKTGRAECVKYLLGIGESVNDGSAKLCVTPIAIAAYAGNLNIVKYLHSRGASLNVCLPKNEYTPLLLACKTNQYAIVEYLLQFEEVRTKKYQFNNSPIVFSIKAKNDKLVSLLIKNKVDLFTKNSQGENILFLAVRENQPIMVNLIYQHCRTLDTENNECITPPQLSIILHLFKVVEVFIHLHANIFYRNSQQLTIRAILAQANDKEAIDFLRKAHLFEDKLETQYDMIEDYALAELNYHVKSSYIAHEAKKGIKLDTDHGTVEVKTADTLPDLSLNSSVMAEKHKKIIHIKAKNSLTLKKCVEDQELMRLMNDVQKKFHSVISNVKGNGFIRSSLPPISMNSGRNKSFGVLKKKRIYMQRALL